MDFNQRWDLRVVKKNRRQVEEEADRMITDEEEESP
jgi:hypothetical protein